jgi:hypothetical protein
MVGCFITWDKLHGQWGTRLETSVRRGWIGHFGRSLWLPGAEVAGAWNNFWSHRYFIGLYLTAKPSHMGVDLDGLAYFLDCSTVRTYQTRG